MRKRLRQKSPALICMRLSAAGARNEGKRFWQVSFKEKRGHISFTGAFLSLLLIPALLLGAGAALAVSVFSLNRPVAPQDNAGNTIEENAQLFVVAPGMSVKEIAASLKEAGLIRSAAFATFKARASNLTLKAGTYRLSPSMTTEEILQAIHKGAVARIKVTVPEGLTLSKTAACFEDAGIRKEDFEAAARDEALLAEFGIPAQSLEGYLFPDTYLLDYGESAMSVVRRMVTNFFEKVAALSEEPSDGEELHKKVILASIVEREYRSPPEAPLIAGVFENRLNANMRLQSCATVEYVITEIEGKPHPERLAAADLEIQNEYNTYRNAGLPPGPISNPGATALAAAFSPANTQYYYFRLTDADAGTHVFTASLDEHIKAGREFYLKAAAGR